MQHGMANLVKHCVGSISVPILCLDLDTMFDLLVQQDSCASMLVPGDSSYGQAHPTKSTIQA